jgi:hypothetical protein
MADETLRIRKETLGSYGMRYHELALQLWLYSTFFVKSGYPIPVVFATPMDAFGSFNKLFASDSNPFRYLFDLKDEDGKPIYEPHPSNFRYPLISVLRRTWRMRASQSYGLHQFRHMNWPTVSSDVGRCDLANVSVGFRPMGWDYRFQIDHYAMRPDTQAYFVEKLMRIFAVGGGTAQAWLPVHYPAWGLQAIRAYIDGDTIENSSKEEPEDQKHVEFQTTVSLVLEGYSVDQDIQIVPALWNLILRKSTESTSPSELMAAFDEQRNIDLRLHDNNPVMNDRSNIPSDEECQRELIQQQ